MNLPSLLQRIAVVGTASVALALLTSDAASANTPMKIVADTAWDLAVADVTFRAMAA